MEVIIYSKDNCPNCLKAKNKLSKHNPKVLMLDKDITKEEFFKKFPNVRQVPQVVINNQHIVILTRFRGANGANSAKTRSSS